MSEFKTKIKNLDEVSNTSTGLLGGNSVKIPVDGAHKGQSGWQSNNAWDIKASIGTPVYAVVGGTLKTYSDYGPTPIKKNGKTLFGAGFTVDSDGGLPDVYYTHLKDVTVKQGSKVECGQLLGYVMDFPNSNYDHLHIGVETGNIKQFLNDDGTLKCGNGSITPGSISSTPSSDLTNDVDTTTYVNGKPELGGDLLSAGLSKIMSLNNENFFKNKRILESINRIKNLL